MTETTTTPGIAASTTTAGWYARGSALFLRTLDTLSDADLDAPTLLPGWTRKHLVAHVASNAEALGRLVSWARTGRETPMYTSPQQRAADIETGARRAAGELRHWAHASAAALTAAFAALPPSAWQAEVVTAQGRRVPATELPWLRAREVCVHSVDLNAGATFAELPAGFCRALVDDVVARRSDLGDGPALQLATDPAAADPTWQVRGVGTPTRISLPVADLAAWLTGRLTRADLPELPRWL
jgi:maleylpyruvate isomerase